MNETSMIRFLTPEEIGESFPTKWVTQEQLSNWRDTFPVPTDYKCQRKCSMSHPVIFKKEGEPDRYGYISDKLYKQLIKLVKTEEDKMQDYDDELTPEMIEAIKTASPATNIPDENFTERLFDKIESARN